MQEVVNDLFMIIMKRKVAIVVYNIIMIESEITESIQLIRIWAEVKELYSKYNIFFVNKRYQQGGKISVIRDWTNVMKCMQIGDSERPWETGETTETMDTKARTHKWVRDYRRPWRPKDVHRNEWETTGDHGDQRTYTEMSERHAVRDHGRLGRLQRPWRPKDVHINEWETVRDCSRLGRLQRPWRPKDVHINEWETAADWGDYRDPGDQSTYT